MTPYARVASRLTQQREQENEDWKRRGDTRVVGDAARERMRERLLVKIAVPTFSDILANLLAAMPRMRRKLGIFGS